MKRITGPAILLVVLVVVASVVMGAWFRGGSLKLEIDAQSTQFADLAIQRKNKEILCTIRPHGDALVGKFINFMCYDSAGKPIWRNGFRVTPSMEYMQKSDRPNEYTYRVVAEWDAVKAADIGSVKASIR